MEGYAGQQFVGIDLHRRRSVIVRTTATGQVLESMRIVNDVDRLAGVMARAGRTPRGGDRGDLRLVLGGRCVAGRWGGGALGASVRGQGVSSIGGSRTMSATPPIWPTCCGWAGCPRHGSRHRPPGSCGSWSGTGPNWSGCVLIARLEIHAVLAKCGVQVTMTDLFGLAGTDLLDGLHLPAPYAARIGSLRRVMESVDFEIDVFATLVRGRLARDPGYLAVQTIPGIGPVLGAVLVAEIGDITRFTRPEQLTSWAGLTPRHRESDTHVHRGRVTKQGSRLVRWAVIESVQVLPKTTAVGIIRDRIGARRGRNIGVVAAGRRQLEYVFYALRDHHVRALQHPRASAA